MALYVVNRFPARGRARPGAAFVLPMALGWCALAVAGAIDTENWRALGTAIWRFDPTGVEAGPDDESSFLVSTEMYGDFRLSVEFWIEDHTNSGIFIRCGQVAEVDDVNPIDCYEVNIFDNHPLQENRTGAIVATVPAAARVETIGKWNRLEVTARGADVDVLVNGTRTATLHDARTSPGPIALQYGGRGLVRFRKLEIASETDTGAQAGIVGAR